MKKIITHQGKFTLSPALNARAGQRALGFIAANVLASTLPFTSFADVINRYSTPEEIKEALMNDEAVNPHPELSVPGPRISEGPVQSPLVGPNVRVNDPQSAFPNGLLGRAETAIAGNEDGERLVIGWNDADGFLRPPFNNFLPGTPGISGYAFSSDGGKSWTDGGVPPVINGIVTRGDPWLDTGGSDRNTFYYANLALDQFTGRSLGVSVHRGRFQGRKFAWNDVVPLSPPNPNDFYDKECLAAAKDSSRAVYMAVTNFREQCGIPGWGYGQIDVWRSHDGGNTWQGPSVAGPEDPLSNSTCGDFGRFQIGPAAAVGPKGEVYVSWAGSFKVQESGLTVAGSVLFSRSVDGGVTFSAPVSVAEINSQVFNAPVGFNRDMFVPGDMPRIAVATSGPQRGRVYVSFSASVSPVVDHPPAVPTPSELPAGSRCFGQSLVSSQSYVSHSDDGGRTWSAPVPVAPPVPATGVKRFFPVVTVEGGGNVNVLYYESQERPAADHSLGIQWIGFSTFRVGAAHSFMDVYSAQSTDGGLTFKAPVRVTTATTDWCNVAADTFPNLGDYISAFAGEDRVFGAWADGRNGIPDTYFSTIKSAGKSK